MSHRAIATSSIAILLLIGTFATEVHAQKAGNGRAGARVGSIKEIEKIKEPPEKTVLIPFLRGWLYPVSFYKLDDYTDPEKRRQIIDLSRYLDDILENWDDPQDYFTFKQLEWWAGDINWDFTPPTFRDRKGKKAEKLRLWLPHPNPTLRFATIDPMVKNKLLEPVLRPIRNFNNHTRREWGIRSYMYAWAGGFWTPDNLPDKNSGAGFAGVGGLHNWIPYRWDGQGIGRLSFSWYYAWDIPRGADSPHDSVGAGADLNYNFDAQGFYWGQLFYSQTFLKERLRVDVGKINSSQFYFYNMYAGDEGWFFQPGLFTQHDALPNGLGGNRPGIGTRFFLPEQRMWVSALVMSPLSDRRKLDFDTIDDGNYSTAVEFAYMPQWMAGSPDITGRMSVGVHYTTTGPLTTRENPEIQTPGWGYTLMWTQDLVDIKYMPQTAAWISYIWNEPQIKNEQWQLTFGVSSDYAFRRRDSGWGVAFGITGYSEEYRPDWRTEKELTGFYRFQLTEDIQMTPEYTLVIHPGNPVAEQDYANVFQLRFFLLF